VTASRTLTLTDGAAEIVIVPELGAGLASYDLVGAGDRRPVFRSCRNISGARPFDLASILLVPWSNRISGGGFTFAGKFHPLEPNLPGEPYPIHGNGFSSAWTVEAATATRAGLSLMSEGPGAFRYAARASYALSAGALTMRLSVVNHAAAPLPFGLGFHPWIVRTPETLLQAKAKRFVSETSDHLPSAAAEVSLRPDWNFAEPRSLPDGWINNAFLDWDGRASVHWPDREFALEVAAESPLTVYIIYSPSHEADFFCFEPVTHAVDAHNTSGGPEANGLSVLAPQESLSIACLFSPPRVGR
jgi:aldose 1-epimerase